MEKTVNKKKALYAFIIIMVILGLAIIFSFRSPLNIFQQTESGRDSSVFQYIATLMKKGAMPYRDTFDHKGPLLYLINYLGISISSRYGIWFIEICFLFISFLGIYRIARLFVKQIPSLIILLASSSLLFEFFDGGNYSEEYSIMFIIIALFIFIDYFINRKISNKRLILLGITFACVCMIRINMIATWLVLCLFVLVESIQQKEYKELIRYLLFFMVGIFIVCVPILLWLVANNSFNEFIHDYFIFNLSYSSSETSIIRARIRTAIYFSRNTIVLLMFMLMLFLLKEDKNKRFNIAYLCYMILTFISVIMSGRMYDHYGMTLVPLFAYPVSRSLNLVAERLELKKDKTIVSLVMLIPIICIALPNWLYYTQDTIGLFMNRGTYQVSSYISDICEVVKSNTDEDDLITYYGSLDMVYLLTGRESASRYSYQFPIIEYSDEVQTNYYMDLEKNLPELVIVEVNRDLTRMNKFLEDNNYQKIWPKEGNAEMQEIYKLR